MTAQQTIEVADHQGTNDDHRDGGRAQVLAITVNRGGPVTLEGPPPALSIEAAAVLVEIFREYISDHPEDDHGDTA